MQNVLAVGRYIQWGVVSISVTNLFIIVATIVVFVLAVLLPFPHQDRARANESSGEKDLP